MSTSILYHGFGLKHHRYLRTEYHEGTIIFHVEVVEEMRRCAVCGSSGVIKKGWSLRYIRTLPIGRKVVFLAAHLHRLLCFDCGTLRQEPLLWSFPKRRWTRALGRYVTDLLQVMTIEDVARHLGMSWDTVKEIHQLALQAKFKRRRLRHLKFLGVDEIAVRKGHRYLTIVVDLESGEVVWVGNERTVASLEPFLKRLKRAGSRIKAIAMDMWQPYLTAVLTHYPKQVVVFDRYHVISDYNRMLDALRTSEAEQAEGAERGVFKGVRYLLLKGQEKLQELPKAKARLNRLLALNSNLSTAYILKEELRQLWNCEKRREAKRCLTDWFAKAYASGIKLLCGFADKLASHAYGILNYFRHRVTTAKVEGINNKIKVLKRKAYGYRDTEYFKLRIYFLHESRYALIG